MPMQRKRIKYLPLVLLSFPVLAFAQKYEYSDPRQSEFNVAVPKPAEVISTQRSNATYGNHRRGTNDPIFVAQELLGRPTDTTITINAVAKKDVDAFFEYGTVSGDYSNRTDDIKFAAGNSVHTLIDNLEPNTRYYYRMSYKEEGAEEYTSRNEYTFHTQRPPGSTFTFVVEADPHMLSNNKPEAFKRSLTKMLADKPDFMLDLGDTFFIDRYLRQGPITQAQITGRVQLLRSYFDIVNHSVPMFLVNGNHEGEWGKRLDGSDENIAVMGTLERKKYFPNPEPNDFYSGSSTVEDFVGLRQANYAWEWGDALFIALDPYWNVPEAPELGGDWDLTLGRKQYDWLKNTLETSEAKYKFVFAHNLIGGLNMKGAMRGGIEAVKYLEMGGYNLDGTWGFDKARPGWGIPIHQLLVAHNATIYFHGHDHFYAYQELDGVVYQETPVPAIRGLTNVQNSAKTYNYVNGTVVNGGGYLRVTVSPEEVKVDFVQTYLAEEEDEEHYDGMIGHSYTIPGTKEEAKNLDEEVVTIKEVGFLGTWQ